MAATRRTQSSNQLSKAYMKRLKQQAQNLHKSAPDPKGPMV